MNTSRTHIPLKTVKDVTSVSSIETTALTTSTDSTQFPLIFLPDYIFTISIQSSFLSSSNYETSPTVKLTTATVYNTFFSINTLLIRILYNSILNNTYILLSWDFLINAINLNHSSCDLNWCNSCIEYEITLTAVLTVLLPLTYYQTHGQSIVLECRFLIFICFKNHQQEVLYHQRNITDYHT